MSDLAATSTATTTAEAGGSLDVLFLSRRDVMALDLRPDEVVAQIALAVCEHAEKTYEMHPKIGVHPTRTHPANFIHAMPAYLKKMEACGLKWVAGFPANPERGLPNVTGIQVYNDVQTGVPLAVMDCSYLTGLRTAAVSALIARHCVRAGATILALAGCGFEGTMHLRYFTALLPALQEVRLYDVRPAAAAALAAEAHRYFGGSAKPCDTPEACLRGADVISTCTNGDDQLIEPEWFQEGAFGVGIEGGCAYTAGALHAADKFIVDDIPLARYFDELGRNRVTADGRPDPEFPGGMPAVYATIGEIVAGRKPGRDSDRERIVAIPIGMAICDIALTRLAYERARARGVGQVLPLL